MLILATNQQSTCMATLRIYNFLRNKNWLRVQNALYNTSPEEWEFQVQI